MILAQTISIALKKKLKYLLLKIERLLDYLKKISKKILKKMSKKISKQMFKNFFEKYPSCQICHLLKFVP